MLDNTAGRTERQRFCPTSPVSSYKSSFILRCDERELCVNLY